MKTVIDENEIPDPKGIEQKSIKEQIDNSLEKNPIKKTKEIIMGLPNNFGVENFVKVIKFGVDAFNGVKGALADDNKVSLLEGLGLAVTLGPQAFGLISAIPQIPQEIVYDEITEEEFQQIAFELSKLEGLEGITLDAVKDFIKILLGLKDWYFNYLVKE